ncbi:hypothetical protein [Arthrobacter sp. NA-172]|uniref:hypothetical protein n=1 Tax=Arthrobacter sp. NA-172 TaxID=3367524 RepID=UPI00375428E0
MGQPPVVVAFRTSARLTETPMLSAVVELFGTFPLVLTLTRSRMVDRAPAGMVGEDAVVGVEEVAPELGMTKTELRRYCRESGIHTRLSNRRIMLHQVDVDNIIEWVRKRREKAPEWWNEQEAEPDPFA